MNEQKANPSIWKRRWPAWLLAVIVLILGLGLLAPKLLQSQKKGPLTMAVQNAKSIGYALWNFEHEYKSYPNDETAKLLQEEYPNQKHRLGNDSANDYLLQLNIAEYVDLDSPFHVDRNDEDERFLGPGECMFAYVIWEQTPNGDAPLLIGPIDPGQKKFSDAFGGRCVLLSPDMSVRAPSIRPNGKDFFDWSQPHWGGQKPKIVWPE